MVPRHASFLHSTTTFISRTMGYLPRPKWSSNNIVTSWISNNIGNPWISNTIRNPWISNNIGRTTQINKSNKSSTTINTNQTHGDQTHKQHKHNPKQLIYTRPRYLYLWRRLNRRPFQRAEKEVCDLVFDNF